MRAFQLLMSMLVSSSFLMGEAVDKPVEIGKVNWTRDFDGALANSKETGKPIFLLFQEVPGCKGCKDFGSTVLSDPLLVEAIEDEFIPVVAYNNVKGGADQKLLKRYNEPAWNFQVVRFLDAKGEDIIPRKDRIWDTGGIAKRMIQALKEHDRPVPKYLQLVADENNTGEFESSAFAMHCYYSGEKRLGQQNGVVSTEAGWIGKSEVTYVVYDKSKTSVQELAAAAAKFGCANKVYVNDPSVKIEGIPLGELTKEYRTAKESDQKFHISRWAALKKIDSLTPMQLTKINAAMPDDRKGALTWLSPRQLKELNEGQEGQ